MERDSEFRGLVDEILEARWKNSPSAATWDGIHAYDHKLEDLSQKKIESDVFQKKKFLNRLDTIPSPALTLNDRLDHKVLTNALRSEVMDQEEIRGWRKDPSHYPSLALNSIYLLSVREFAPLSERVEAMRSRLKKIPGLLAQGTENVTEPAKVFTDIACQVTEGGIEFLSNVVPSLDPSLADPAREAAKAFHAYLEHLRTKLIPRSTDRFAIGQDAFEKKLLLDHGLSFSSGELREIGERIAQETEKELEVLASKIDPGKGWKEIVAESKEHHPQPKDLLESYRKAMALARDFVLENGLVDFAIQERIEVVPTPLFERATTPYAALMSPAPFEEDQKSLFYVTPAEPPLSKEEQAERLKGHSFASIPVTALHEAYPGHHLQLAVANRIASKVRRVIGTPLFWEGWALYCEEMMYEAGFYSDPRVRLFQLKDALWRACRVIVDVGLHAEGMDFRTAVALLVERADLEEPNAISEVQRYCQTPTYPMSYMMGKQAILQLRAAMRDREGPNFSLRSFHNRLLSYGSIPIPYIQRAMLDGTVD